jgi:hypothetical protein
MTVANVVVGVVGGVYAATQSVLLAALALGVVAFVWARGAGRASRSGSVD